MKLCKRNISLCMGLACFFVAAGSGFSNELTLESYLSHVLANNYEVYHSKSEYDAAVLTSKYALTQLFPSVDIAGGALATNLIDGWGKANFNFTSPFTPLEIQLNEKLALSAAAINVNQLLFAGGMVFNSNKLAAVNKEAYQNKYTLKQNEIYMQAQKKFFDYSLLLGQIQTLEEYVEMLNNIHSRAAQGYTQGVISKSDYLKAKFKLDELIIERDSLLALTNIAFKDLLLFAQIKNTDDITILVPKDISDSALEYNPDSFTLLVRNRPEYKLLEMNIRAAKLKEDLEIGKSLPKISVGANFALAGLFTSDSFPKSAIDYQNFAAYIWAVIPVSSWWGTAYNAKEKQIQKKTALKEFEYQKDYLLLDIEKKWIDYQTAIQKLKAAELNMAYTKANTSENKDGYQNGTRFLSDYLTALALEYESRVKHDKAKADIIEAQTAFLFAIGEYPKSLR